MYLACSPSVVFLILSKVSFKGKIDIIDYKGKELCTLNAPENGMVFGLRAMPNVTTGDWCCFYAIIEGTWDK